MVDDRHYKEGFDAYFFIVTIAPQIRDAWLNFGFTALQLGDHLSAIEAYGRARTLDPQKPDSYLATCAAYISQKKYDVALNACDLGIEFATPNENEPWAQELLSVLQEAKSQITILQHGG
jgi:tetratricopeptide (TPR) repeat protein